MSLSYKICFVYIIVLNKIKHFKYSSDYRTREELWLLGLRRKRSYHYHHGIKNHHHHGISHHFSFSPFLLFSLGHDDDDDDGITITIMVLNILTIMVSGIIAIMV